MLGTREGRNDKSDEAFVTSFVFVDSIRDSSSLTGVENRASNHYDMKIGADFDLVDYCRASYLGAPHATNLIFSVRLWFKIQEHFQARFQGLRILLLENLGGAALTGVLRS